MAAEAIRAGMSTGSDDLDGLFPRLGAAIAAVDASGS